MELLSSNSNRASREDTSANNNSSFSSSSKRNTPSECRTSPLLGRSSVERRTTPASVHTPEAHHSRPKSGGEKTPTSLAVTSSASSSSTAVTASTSHEPSSSSSSADPAYSSSSLGLDFSRDSLMSANKAGLNGLNPLALANCSGCSPVAGHIPLDYPALKGGYSFVPPYMNYAARMKGASTLVPVACRDPYCTNCQLAAQLPYTQDRLGFYPSAAIPGYPGFASSAFASSVLPRPNVCNWMVGDTYCGKRFASSEELLQHLRTHTSLSTSLPLYSQGLAMDLYSSPSFTTTAGLRRTYPTSLSPVSSLSARYHPYKPPGLSPLSSAPLPPLGHPGLGFYNPYSGVYGKG